MPSRATNCVVWHWILLQTPWCEPLVFMWNHNWVIWIGLVWKIVKPFYIIQNSFLGIVYKFFIVQKIFSCHIFWMMGQEIWICQNGSCFSFKCFCNHNFKVPHHNSGWIKISKVSNYIHVTPVPHHFGHDLIFFWAIGA
jgi:hypothetical protein